VSSNATPARHPPPADAEARRGAPALTVYRVELLPPIDLAFYEKVRRDATKIDEVVVPPRDGRAVQVPAGHLFRINCVEGPQVGDMNLWSADNLDEQFFSGKTRQMHATHVGAGDRLWSSMPYLRPMATIVRDTLDWYGWDDDGAGVHDVIGTRCDPYTRHMLSGEDYDHFCHSNLTRALAAATGRPADEVEPYVHDVMNVFMCTGFMRDTHQYFKKASPVRPGDFIEMFAEIDLLVGLSACPNGDCGGSAPAGEALCHPLVIEVYRPLDEALAGWRPPEPSGYPGHHGLD